MKASIKFITFMGGLTVLFSQSQANANGIEREFLFRNGVALYFKTPVENVEVNTLLQPNVCHEISAGSDGVGTLVSSLDVLYYKGRLFNSKVGTALIRIFVGPFSGTQDEFLYFLTKLRKANLRTGADNDNDEVEINQSQNYFTSKFGGTLWVEYRITRKYGGLMYDFATTMGNNAYARVTVTLINRSNFSGVEWQERARRDVLYIVESWRVREDGANCQKE